MPFSYDINLDDTARAKRRRRSQSHESIDTQSIDTKALGANLGSLARGAAVFDPNAYDGDGDGLVQDSTPFERPAVLANVAALSRGFASATGKWGNTFDGWTVGKTNEEIAEVVVPDNPADLLSYIHAHIGAHGLSRVHNTIDEALAELPLDKVDFTPETIAKTRRMVVDTLDKYPAFREMVDRFGIPPIVPAEHPTAAGKMYRHLMMSIDTYSLKEYGNTNVSRGSGERLIERIGGELGISLDHVVDSELIGLFAGDRLEISDHLRGVVVHEYGHYMVQNAILNHPDPDVRQMFYVLEYASWEQIADEGYSERWNIPTEWTQLARSVLDGIPEIPEDADEEYLLHDYFPDDEIAPASIYGMSSPSEMMAELFEERVLSPKTNTRASRDFHERLTGNTGGFASSSTLPASEEMYDMTPEQLAEAAIPDSPEKAQEALESWSQWAMDLMGEEWYDSDTKGMSAKERVQLEIKRSLYHVGKYRGEKWKKSIRKARRHKGDVSPDEVFDFSPEMVEKARASLVKAFREQPQFFEHVRTFGMPPILVSRNGDLPLGAFFNGSTGAMFIMMNRDLLSDIDEISEGAPGKGILGTEWFLEVDGKWTPHSTYGHEYGHFINFMASMAHPDREARYLAGYYWRMEWDDVNPKGIKGWKLRKKWEKWRKENPLVKLDRADTRYSQSAELERAIGKKEAVDWDNGPPHVLSEYGQSSPAEMFAEAYSAFVSNDPEREARVSPAMRSDLEMIVGRAETPNVTEMEVDTSQNAARSTGFASISITRNEDGTRDMARAFSGEDDSPLKGSNWLKDATPREIAQALVPRSREDAVNLALQHMLMGNTNPDPHVLAAVKGYIEGLMDHDLFDFSPEGIAMMEDWLEKTLNESPQFLWTVRRFGSSPIIPTNRDSVARYREARRNGQRIPIPTSGTRRHPIYYPIGASDIDGRGNAVHNTDEEAMNLMFGGIVDKEGILGFNASGLFTVINLHHRGWRGLFGGDKEMPRFGRTRRVSMGRTRGGVPTPFPETDMLGRDYISNFSTSLEGTIVHEYNHQMWSSLFGIKTSLAHAPRLRDRVARVAGIGRRDLEALSGDRYSRAAYMYPNLTPDDALARMTFAKEQLSDGSLSMIPHPIKQHGDWRSLVAFTAINIYGASDKYDELMERVQDYTQGIVDRGKSRILDNPQMGEGWMRLNMLMRGLDFNSEYDIQKFVWDYGWDPVEMENTWRGLAEDYPEVFGDSRLPFAGLAGNYAQTNPQETWAELGTIMAQPDADYRDEYVTPEMTAAYLYILGEHDDPFDTRNMSKPWESTGQGGTGFASASRARKVEHARETVIKRASNTLGNVASTKQPVEPSQRRVSIKKGSEGHTYFSLGDYKFKIPGDRFMPEISNAYTEWASDSHYDIQRISGLVMGIPEPTDNQVLLRGRIGVSMLRNGGNVSELDENTLFEIRSSAARAKRMMDEVRDSETYSSVPLYHTMSRLNDNNEMLKAEIGDTIHMPLTSFSPAITQPNEIDDSFSMSTGDKSAIVKLAIGASVFDSNLLENVSHDGEWRDMPIESITGGRFKVVSKTERNGIPYIEIEHTDVFDADKGEFVNIDPSESMAAVKEMVLIDRSMREIEKLHKRRKLVEISDPAHDAITGEINNQTELLVNTMFGDIPEPTMNLSQESRDILAREIEFVESIPISSMDKVNMPGFASTSREMGFNRIIRPERRVAKSAIRTLKENREYIEDRMMSGRTREVLDGDWIDRTIERLESGEITHTDAMDIMNILMDIVSDRIRRDPSVRDATDGDVYHYQKLGKRLRRAMLNGLSDEDLTDIRVEQGIEKRRPSGFASTAGFASTSSNTRKDIVGRFNPTVRRGRPYGGDEWRKGQEDRKIPEVVVYDINGEKVVFGVEDRHKLDVSDVKNIPLNPYEITGLERGTKEGDEMALKWAYAHIGSNTSDNGSYESNSTEMSALLYAAINGDEDARREFERYAEEGRQKLDAQRQALIDKTKQDAEKLKADRGFLDTLRVIKHGILYNRKKRDTPDYTYIGEGEADKVEITTKDLVLVRWSEFPPDYDEDGNVVLSPAGDYVDFDRETIHFTLNHAVEEHWGWQQRGGGYLIMVPLSDVLDDNGTESMGNLYGVDTYFTPKPGQKLKLRKGSTVVRQVSEGEDRKAIASQILQDDFATISVKGTPNFVDYPGFDDMVVTIAADLGVPRGTLHQSRGHGYLERINNQNVDDMRNNPLRNNQGVAMDEFFLTDIDENSILRHIDRRHGKPTGVSLRTEVNPDARVRPFVSIARTQERDLAKDITNPEAADLVRSIQNKYKGFAGFASRSDAVNPGGKTSDEIAQELELTPEEISILDSALPNEEDLLRLIVNPAITQEQKKRIIDSIRIRVEDGIPFFTVDPHPLVIDEIPDKRDWSTVVAPSRERQLEILDLLERMGEKVDTTERRTIDQRADEVKLNTVAFSAWLMDMWDRITERNAVPNAEENPPGTYVSTRGGASWGSAFVMYFSSLYNMGFSGIREFFGDDDFLNAHDLWGHIAIGRGFDRHGEWANMLAIFSLMDRWGEEEGISRSDILRMKAKWFQNLEYTRFGDRFVRDRDETSPNSSREWFERERGIWDSLDGMAEDDDLEELIGLLDHGRVHDTANNSKGFASATRDERASIAASDIVRQSRRLSEMNLPVKGEETGDAIVKEMGLTGKAAQIAKQAFQRSLESISSGRLKRYKFAKGVDEHKSRIIDSIRIAISADDVPMIMADPHPVFFRLLNDRRNWSVIEVPSSTTVSEFLKKLKEGRNPLSFRERGAQADATSGMDKFRKWADEKIQSLIESASRQDTPSRLRGTLIDDVDLDDELKIFDGDSSWVNLFVGSLVDGKNATGGADDTFDMLHEAIGHVAIGRGFDRHGEYANGLAVLSLLKHPEVEKLMTKGEIQQVARHIMSNYLVDRLEQARPDAVGSVLDDGKPYPYNRSRLGELMQLVREYDGDIWELVDILEGEVDKTPAFREDGSPIEPRPKGFASSNRNTLSNATGQDLARIVNADAKHTGFASSTSEWRTTTHGIELKRDMPDTEVAHADQSGTTQKRIPIGNEVTHPRTGERVKLDSPEQSIDFVSFGGNLSEVPDEHLIESILRNSISIPGEQRSGWRLSKPGGRFEFLGAGGGVHGMIRLKDQKTGAYLGLKFEASTNFGMNDELIPIVGNSDRASVNGAVIESIANTINEELGFAPMPIRIVRRSSLGAGEQDSQAPTLRPGIAFVTELAQNRHGRIIDDGQLLDTNSVTREDVSPISALRVGLIDAVMDNRDRNVGNYLLAAQPDGSIALVPIDHGEAVHADMDKDLEGLIIDRFLFARRNDLYSFGQMSKNEISQMVRSVMKDYRDDLDSKHRRVREETQRVIAQATGLLSDVQGGSWTSSDSAYLYREIDEGVENVLGRWKELADMSDEEITDLLWEAIGGAGDGSPGAMRRAGFASTAKPDAGFASSTSRKVKKVVKVYGATGKPRTPAATTDEFVARAIPTSAEQVKSLLKDSPYSSGKGIRDTMKKLEKMDVDWEKQELLAQRLRKLLNENPEFATFLGEHDIPPMFVTRKNISKGGTQSPFLSDPESWFGTQGQYHPGMGILAFPEHIATGEAKYGRSELSADEILVHELAHTIHAMSVEMRGEARDALKRDWESSFTERAGDEMSEYDIANARLISNYATRNRLEYIAETMRELFYPQGRAGELQQAHFEMLSEFLGIPVERLRAMARARRSF